MLKKYTVYMHIFRFCTFEFVKMKVMHVAKGQET